MLLNKAESDLALDSVLEFEASHPPFTDIDLNTVYDGV